MGLRWVSTGVDEDGNEEGYNIDDGTGYVWDSGGNLLDQTTANPISTGNYTPEYLRTNYPGLVTEDPSVVSTIGSFLKNAGTAAFDKIKGAYTKKVNGQDVTDWRAIAATAGGLYGLYQSNQPQQPSGYQGKIPKLEAVRQQVANTYDPTRRPGSGNQTYFTDTKYAAPADVAAARTAAGTQATGLEALNKANPAKGTIPVAPAVTQAVAGLETLKKLPVPKYAEGEKLMLPEYDRKNPSTAIPNYLTNAEYLDPNSVSMVIPGRPGQGNLMEVLTGGGAKSRSNPNPYVPFMPVVGGERTYTPEEIAQQQQELAGKVAANVGQPQAVSGLASMQAAEAAAKSAAKSAAQPQAMAAGGIASMAEGRYLGGATDGMADKIPARIGKDQEARLSHGEFVVPADVVGHLGNGNSEAGAKRLYEMMDRIRQARTGNSKQGKQINPNKFLPA